MRTTLTLAAILLPLLASALPEKTLREIIAEKAEACPSVPGATCSGAELKDVIISYPKDITGEQKTLVKDAVTGSGGSVSYDYKDLG